MAVKSCSDTKIYDKNSPSSAKKYINNINKNNISIDEKSEPYETPLEMDPFQRTGCPFGCLINEVKYRYSNYLSDLKDGFSLHCLIAFIFIFTVCVSPALTFGGILGTAFRKKIKIILKTKFNLF